MMSLSIKKYCIHIIVILFLMAICQSSTISKESLIRHYDDGSQMSKQIIEDYLLSQECLLRCTRYGKEELYKSFDVFKAIWMQKMINYVIKQLHVDFQTSKQILKNPKTYMINYQTFKLLAFE